MGTFGQYTVARLGITAAQTAMNITGHNIANINTQGYTRQTTDQYSFITQGSGLYRSSNSASVGSGVMVKSISQMRDPYLDTRYRKEVSSVGWSEGTIDGLEQVQSSINDVNKEGVTTQLQDLYDRFNLLNTEHIEEQEFNTLVRTSAETLCTLLNKTAANLETNYQNILAQYEQDVQTADGILSKIQALNEQIRRSDINGEDVLELRDERNMLIDDLANYMRIEVSYGEEDLGVGFSVEKLTIHQIDAQTGRADKMLIDGINRAKLTINQVDNPDTKDPGDTKNEDALRLHISELVNPKGEEVSNTTSLYRINGLAYKAEATSGPVEVKVKLQLPNGSGEMEEMELTVPFSVTAPDATATTAEKIEARKQSFEALTQALADAEVAQAGGKAVKLGEYFTITSAGADLKMESIGKGNEAAVITSITFGDNVEGLAFGPSKTEYPAPSNQTIITEEQGYGKLESTRRMLTGEGDFRADGGDISVRGIPYYQKYLDGLASRFAAEMNRVNTQTPTGEAFAEQQKSGNLFVAQGDDPTNPVSVITAKNISIASSWKSGATSVVRAVEYDENQSTHNDNITRFLNVLNAEFSFAPSNYARNQTTNYIPGAIEQKQDLTGQELTARITYIDETNYSHTLDVSFQGGADSAATETNMYQALKDSLGAIGFDKVAKDGIHDTTQNSATGLNQLVTGLSILGQSADGSGKLELQTEKISIKEGTTEGGYARSQNNRFQLGTISQQTDLTAKPLSAKVTYLDAQDAEQTVEVDFQGGKDADETQKNMLAALQTTLGKLGFDQIDATGIMDTSATSPYNQLVTQLTIHNKGVTAPTTDLTLSGSKVQSTISGATMYQGNFESAYANMEAVLGSDYTQAETIYNTYNTAAESLNNARDSVSGVDLNEEGINILQFQRAFQASCRMMTALDELMDKVINGMGVVGR